MSDTDAFKAIRDTDGPRLPFERSVGHQIRAAHRVIQRLLQSKLAPLGVAPGMWWFLRVLWEEDGLTQRELSRKVGVMESTTMSAILGMEQAGLVHRKSNPQDRRKLNVYLTASGLELKRKAIPVATHVVEVATKGFTPREIDLLLGLLADVIRNVGDELEAAENITCCVEKE